MEERKTLPDIVQWQELANEAMEFNPYYEPWFLNPHINSFDSVIDRVLTVDGAKGYDGVFHFERDPRFPWRSFGSHYGLRLVTSPYIFFSAPLVRSGAMRRVVAELLNEFNRDAKLLSISLGPLYEDSLCLSEMQQSCQEQRASCLTWRARLRPYFLSNTQPSTYLDLRVTRSSLKKLEKKSRQLGAFTLEGEVRDEDIADFLFLEGAGWKGAEGTALNSSSQSREFFTEMIKRGVESKRISLAAISAEKRQAMKVIFTNGTKEFGFKICHDESLDALSPGSVLEFHLIQNRLSTCPRKEADSCAAPGSITFERLWKTNRVMVEHTIFRPGIMGTMLRDSLAAARSLRRAVKN